ncbi:hypothetical protein QQF64_025721 [Cirrhinus molitorella]|uniref:Ubiquitin-like protease family profile domain-containing protein n=1 Tax=Cirrhinus molitorella TaxID=172907 RepID=A0ABR3NPY1_9TELE
MRTGGNSCKLLSFTDMPPSWAEDDIGLTTTLLNHYQQMQHLKTASYFQYGHLDIGTCVMIATKLVAGNWQLIKNKDIPSQRDSLNCGVFMLMYALYITFEWPFDFTQTDMPYIRECWLNLVLKCMSHKREAPSLEEDQVNYMYGCFKDHGILALPAFVLEDIFIDVVLQEGDEAILTLALVCTHFRDLVTREAQCHKLDVETHLKIVFQDMWVEEEEGKLIKIISEDTHPGFCSEFCQICADLL